MSFWRQPKFNTRFKSGGVVPDASLARSAATGKTTVEDGVVPEIFSPYTRNLVSTKTLLALAGVEPNFEGVGDTMGFDGPAVSLNQGGSGSSGSTGGPGSTGGAGGTSELTSYSQQDYATMECVWCGGYGTHKPDCKALSRNYPRSSLSIQREMTQRLRSEMDKTVERTYYEGDWNARSSPRLPPTPPKDERTDLQKRFDAIAEELEENK